MNNRMYLWIAIGAVAGTLISLIVPGLNVGFGLGIGIALGIAFSLEPSSGKCLGRFKRSAADEKPAGR